MRRTRIELREALRKEASRAPGAVQRLRDAGICGRPTDAEGLSAQLDEGMARLGCRLLDAAAALTESPRPEDSGIFERMPACPGESEGWKELQQHAPAHDSPFAK